MTTDPRLPFPRPSLLRGGVYASGNFAKNIIWSATELALLFVFTDVLGVPAALAGAIILVSLIWDALLDPFVGALADRIGRFGPLIWFCAPLLGASFAALFATPAAGFGGVWFAAGALLALRTAYSLVDVPHNALIARMARTSEDRALLSAVRFVFSAGATFALGLTLPPILAAEPATAARDALALWGVIVAAAATIILMATAKAAAPFDRAPPASFTPTPAAILAHLLAPLRKPRVRAVLALAFVGNGLSALLAKSALYFADQALGDESLAGGAIMALAIGQVGGMPIWIALARSLGPGRALVVAHGVAAVCALPMLVGPDLTPTAFLVSMGLHGVGTGGVFTLIWPLASDAGDGDAGKAGSSGGAIFGLVIMVMQVASGLGTSLVALGLSAAGYAPDAPSEGRTFIALAAFALAPSLAGLAACAILRRSP